MAYGVEYRHEYYDINDVTHKVDILLDGYGGGVTTIEKSEHPNPVVLRAKGNRTLEETIIMPTELTFIFYIPQDTDSAWSDIFEADYKAYKIKHQIN